MAEYRKTHFHIFYYIPLFVFTQGGYPQNFMKGGISYGF